MQDNFNKLSDSDTRAAIDVPESFGNMSDAAVLSIHQRGLELFPDDPFSGITPYENGAGYTVSAERMDASIEANRKTAGQIVREAVSDPIGSTKVALGFTAIAITVVPAGIAAGFSHLSSRLRNK